jgi:predicted cobalt transporter CbtA
MTVRNFLISGLLAGLVAGVFTFLVANVVGEPSIDTAISIEKAGAAHSHESEPAAGDDDAGTEVSRGIQKTSGLATATLAVGPAVGGIIALVAAAAVGRLGRLTPRQSTATVALVGFVSVSLVPFLKYPATPPAVGNEDTIGARTANYFGYLLISVVAAVAAVLLARYLLDRLDTFYAVLVGAAAYLVVVVVAGALMPTVNEIGDFPGDTLWYFRRASLLTLATLWTVLGVVLTALVGRLYQQERQTVARRELAASL